MGYYLPETTAVPDLHECNRTLEGVMELCATNSSFNGGGVNVGVLPDFGSDGEAGVGGEGEVRWLMAPERLTTGFE